MRNASKVLAKAPGKSESAKMHHSITKRGQNSSNEKYCLIVREHESHTERSNPHRTHPDQAIRSPFQRWLSQTVYFCIEEH